MFYGVDQGLKDYLFQGAPQDCAWIGDIFPLTTNAEELVPVRFGRQDFLVGFSSPLYAAGNSDELLNTLSESDADGFDFHPSARLVKFTRLEATSSNQYNPEAWNLDKAEQIYQFSQTLGQAVVAHAEALSACQQYFFWATNERLELLYKRTFRYIDRTCLPGEFEPILEKTGVLNGYQRTQNHQPIPS